MNEIPSDPLAKLFVKEEIDRQLLADTVEPFANIYLDDGTPQILYTDAGDQLTVKEKILIFLLVRKVLALWEKGLVEKEAMTPKEIEEGTGILGGSVRPVLKQLLEIKFVQQEKTQEGRYFVPNRALKHVSALLSKKGIS